ncbi:hypothetical protein AQUCO_00300893v1 [Aquilegia coerulea]|uniref:Carrier domain-containing protein n=1 Tax=Aquilegia coerulea TaxID=218851 RepID=A0A2G5F121_AQUCA|nr:hypothetical protein AQUCO_00300893v1 [Aquilegia coerulea]
MAAFTANSISVTSLMGSKQATNNVAGLRSVSLSAQRISFPALRLQQVPLRFRVSCAAAKPETIAKVCDIVKKQLALPEDSSVSAESKFSSLGADSLDTYALKFVIMSL